MSKDLKFTSGAKPPRGVMPFEPSHQQKADFLKSFKAQMASDESLRKQLVETFLESVRKHADFPTSPQQADCEIFLDVIFSDSGDALLVGTIRFSEEKIAIENHQFGEIKFGAMAPMPTSNRIH